MTIPVVVVTEDFSPDPDIEWPDTYPHFPIPRTDDIIELGDSRMGVVRRVIWYPYGDDGSPQPYVELRVGPWPSPEAKHALGNAVDDATT
jgi:hypothetical protein